MSSSNSQVESPVLRSQMTLTRLTAFPRRSLTLLSSKAMSGTSTVRSSLICISSASNTWAGSNTYFLNCETWNTGEGLPTAEVKLSHRPLAQSSSWFDVGQGTWAKASLSGEPFPRPWFGHPQEYMITSCELQGSPPMVYIGLLPTLGSLHPVPHHSHFLGGLL